MPHKLIGDFSAFILRDDWTVFQGAARARTDAGLNVHLVPKAAVRNRSHYASLQIRELCDPDEKVARELQLASMGTPQAAAQLLASMGLQAVGSPRPLKVTHVQGRACRYRVMDARTASGALVRCYVGLVSWHDQEQPANVGVSVIAITLLSIWPEVLPQLLEMITTVGAAEASSAAAAPHDIYVRQNRDGTLAYKIAQADGSLHLFDALRVGPKPDAAWTGLGIDQDVRYEGRISSGFRVSFVEMGESSAAKSYVRSRRPDPAQDPEQFARLLTGLLATVRATGADDREAKLGEREIEKALSQAQAGEDRGAIARTLHSAVQYLQRSEQVARSALNVGNIVAWLGQLGRGA